METPAPRSGGRLRGPVGGAFFNLIVGMPDCRRSRDGGPEMKNARHGPGVDRSQVAQAKACVRVRSDDQNR